MLRRTILSVLTIVLCLSLPAMAGTKVDMTWDMQNGVNEFIAGVRQT